MSDIPIESYACMRAEMDVGALRDDVLAREGISTDEWIDMQRHWLDKMGQEIDIGRFEVTNQYTRAFLARQQQFAASDHSLDQQAHPDLGSTMLGEVVLSPDFITEVTLFRRNAPPPAPAPVMSARSEPAPDPRNTTAPGGIPAFDDPLPFQDAESPQAHGGSAEPGAGHPARGATLPGEPTTNIRAGSPAQSDVNATAVSGIPVFEDPLPFHPNPRAAAPAGLTDDEPHPELGGTTEFEPLPKDIGAPPFRTQSEAEKASTSTFPPRGFERSSFPAPHAPDPGDSAVFSLRAPAPPTSPARPDAQAMLTQEQYASLCAELRVFPHATADVFKRYGLADDKRRQEVDAHWKKLLAEDKAAYSSWIKDYWRYTRYWTQRSKTD